MNMTTFTIELDDQHLAVLDQLCIDQGLNRSQLLRQSLRLYQAAHVVAAPCAVCRGKGFVPDYRGGATTVSARCPACNY